MRILVCGSRDWTDAEAIRERLWLIPYVLPDVPLIMHGAAQGADAMADDAARLLGMPTFAFPADWERHGKRAGILRNLQMLDENPDLVIAFQVNGSRGTQHTIDEARRRGIPVEVHSRDDGRRHNGEHDPNAESLPPEAAHNPTPATTATPEPMRKEAA